MAKYSLEHARKMSKKWNKEIEKKVMSDPESRDIYQRKHREIEIALLMRKTREKANLSQEDVAERMHTTRSAVSRLESSGTGRHSPSLETLLKYAQALGYSVKINLVPAKEHKSGDK
jgi:DNA-binding XRE family transcriptional regulator